jgi:hypothetical protein
MQKVSLAFPRHCWRIVAKTLKVFTTEEGGYEHCQGDNVTLGITYIADWFADRLEARRRA